MAIKTIETRAVISASDQTGATFSAVAEKLKSMEGVAKRAGEMAGKVGGNFGAIAPKVDGVSRSIDAMGIAIAGMAAVGVAKLKTLAESVIEVGAEFDRLVRKQRAVLDITPAQQAPLIAQARRLGATTPFNDLRVTEAQTGLAQRGIPPEAVIPITEVAAAYAQAQGADLPVASKQLEAAFFSGGGKTEGKSPEQIKKDFSQLADRLVKTAQTGGLDADELALFVKRAFPSGEPAGMSLPFILSEGATLKKAGIPGEEAGTAARAFVNALVKPTAGALNVFDALGIPFKNFAKAGTDMQASNLSASFEREIGRKLSAKGLADVQNVLSNPAIAGDQGKLTHALMKIFGADEKLKPQDSRAMAKVIEKFWKASLAGVDVEGLMKALINKPMSEAQAVEIFGGRQGGRFMEIQRHAKEQAEYEKKIREAPTGLAAKQAEIQMGGLFGAKARAEGAWLNVQSRIAQDVEKYLTPLYNAEAKLETAFVEATPEVRALMEAAAGAATALVVLGGAHASLRAVDRLAGGGTMFGAAAGGLGWLGGALIPAAPAVAAGIGAGLLGGSTPLNAGEDERARQLRYGQGWLSDAPPSASGFSGGVGAFKTVSTKLEGAATIKNTLAITLDPGLISKEIRSQLDAGGNLKADTGVSMPRR